MDGEIGDGGDGVVVVLKRPLSLDKMMYVPLVKPNRSFVKVVITNH